MLGKCQECQLCLDILVLAVVWADETAGTMIMIKNEIRCVYAMHYMPYSWMTDIS